MIGPNYSVSDQLMGDLAELLNAYAQAIPPEQMVCILQMFVVEAERFVPTEGN